MDELDKMSGYELVEMAEKICEELHEKGEHLDYMTETDLNQAIGRITHCDKAAMDYLKIFIRGDDYEE